MEKQTKLTDIVSILPSESDLQIVVILQQSQKPCEQVLALMLSQTIDVSDVTTDGEDTLPARDGVCPDNGMDSLQLCSNVLWSASWFVVELVSAFLGSGDKVRLLESCGQGLQELLVWLGDSVIELVAGCPEGVTTGLGQVNKTKGRVICWLRFKCNIAVPLSRVLFLWLELAGIHSSVELTVNGRDLRIGDLVTLTLWVKDWVDVKTRCLWLAGEKTNSLDQLLLEIGSKVILGAEENDTSLGD